VNDPLTPCNLPAGSARPTAFTDYFDGPAGSAPNPKYWSYHTGAGGSDGQLQAYTNSTRNASLDGNGYLNINAIKETVNVPGYGNTDYTSAALTTTSNVSVCYGTLRARIKFPPGQQGLWPAFWMLGSDLNSVGWPACGEIDVMEYANNSANADSNLHGPGTYSVPAQAAIDVGNAWHNYTVDWRRNRITTSIDDVTVGSWTPDSLPSGSTWTFNDHPMFALLNLAIGGQGGPPDSSTVFPATMQVDWVRYVPPS
jgi:beta-glucanase (GH16 family)